jgi:hypothetical protein
MATVDGIGLQEPSTVTKSLAAALIQRNSSNTYQELMCIADPDSTTSSAIAKVLNSVPGSTAWGLVVREADPSTGPFVISSITGPVTVRSSAANFLATIYQSTATDLLARVNQGVGNSSAADRWRVNVANSSAADYIGVRLVDSSGTGFLTPGNEYTAGSTYSSFAGPTLTFDNGSNATFRHVASTTPLPVSLRSITGPSLLSTGVVITSSNSTAIYSLESSAAGVRHKVFAYSLTSTQVTPSTLIFMTGSTTYLWKVAFGSGSSGIAGANLAVSPPAWLFQAASAGALQCVIENAGSTQTIVTLGYSFFTEA